MDIEEIESLYQTELTEAERKFLEKPETVSLKDAQIAYSNSIKLSKERYYNSVHNFLEKEKKKKKKKILAKFPKTKPFQADTKRAELSRIKKISYKINIIWFKITFNLKNKIKGMIPNFLNYNYIKIKIKIKNNIIKLKDYIRSLIQSILDKLKNAFQKSKEMISNSFNKINTLIEKMFTKKSASAPTPSSNQSK